MDKVRKILEHSSEKKNHNGAKKVPVEKSWRGELKILRVRLSQMIASLKKKGHRRLVFNVNPKNKEGKKVADFSIHFKGKEIVRFKLNRSLTVLTVWMIGSDSFKIQSFNEFLNELGLLRKKIAILLR